MRTSRVSRDAAKIFDRAPGSASPPRRITRAALSRFSNAPSKSADDVADIEDAVGRPTKRRKTTTTKFTRDAIKSELVEDALTTFSPSKARSARKPARKKTDPLTGETTTAPPSDWDEVYNVVKAMRSEGGLAHGAAVDTMGCERLADDEASERDQRFHTLVALMLSSQTKDTVNAVAMKRLKTEMPPYQPGAKPGLNLDNMLAVDPDLLNKLIWAVGFHNNKTKYLKAAAQILRDQWNDDIPDSIEGLMSLPGVGPKMAYLCLSAAWDRTEGIGVDVHVHRITNLWGWQASKTPEETRLALQAWLPKDKWREINHMLVGFGQTICLPVGRKCGDCELGLRGLCRSAERKKVIQGRRVKEEKIEVQEDGGVVKTEKVEEEVKIKDEVINKDT